MPKRMPPEVEEAARKGRKWMRQPWRKDRQRAEQVGNTIKQNFPTEPIYVHFYSPRWICRVGNYRTYEEAHEMLMNIRKLGISGASIVKGKITVQY